MKIHSPWDNSKELRSAFSGNTKCNSRQWVLDSRQVLNPQPALLLSSWCFATVTQLSSEIFLRSHSCTTPLELDKLVLWNLIWLWQVSTRTGQKMVLSSVNVCMTSKHYFNSNRLWTERKMCPSKGLSRPLLEPCKIHHRPQQGHLKGCILKVHI